MKKHIITSFLFAAGTLLGNAATLSLSDAKYVQTGGTSITFDSTYSSITTVVTLDIDALKGVMLAGTSLSKHTLVDFTDSDANDIGLQTNYSSSGNVIRTSGLYGTWNQGGAYRLGLDSGFESTSFWENATDASATLSYSYGTGTTAVFSVKYNDGRTTTLGGTWATNLKGGTAAFDKVVFDQSIVTGAWVFDSVVTSINAKSLSISAIPEPSAFGLLAGLGGLALVASRRRRK
ncbi:MAG: PEP-CTERM sorting domain-containing protein [Opitutales bacterium]|nr:PEP-CTERM sorting domain-containing protein [Opitutales bacterium]